MQAEQENIQPNRYLDDLQLSELIRQNMDHQQQQRIKNTLMKQSLVKLSLDKDFQHLYQLQASPKPQAQDQALLNNKNNNLVQVSKEVKQVCEWLQQSDQFKGMTYLPYNSLPKMFHILHQKIENTVIIVTDYHSHWLEKMQDMNRLSVMKWAFLNTNLSRDQKVKVLQLYQMKKIKLLFISPSIFNHQQYLEFDCDILVIPDLHLFSQSKQLMNKIIGKCSPGRVLGVHSNPMKKIPLSKELGMRQINSAFCQNNRFSPTMVAVKCQSQNDEKFKTLLAYLQKNQQLKQTLILVNSKQQAGLLSKKMKLKSLTSFNIHQYLNPDQINYFTNQQILQRNYKNSTNGQAVEDKVMETMYKSKGYNVTISKYFDALRFANFDSIIFYNFVDIPKFITNCADINHRVLLLADDDYFTFRNEITKNIFPLEGLAKIILKIMQKPKKKDQNPRKRYFSEFIQSNAILSCYSVTKQAIQKNQQKVLRINNFCKIHDVSQKALFHIIQSLCSLGILQKICKLTYQIQISEQSLNKFRKQYPDTIEIRSRVSLLGLATALQLTTNQTLQQILSKGINYKITQQALQLRILKEYGDINFEQVQKLVNQNIMIKVKQFDQSYILYKDLSYCSVQLTRRQKLLGRWKKLIEFYEIIQSQQKSQLVSMLTNIFESTHKSNLLTSEIQQWLRNRQDECNLNEHQLILLLQGVQHKKLIRFKEEPIVGRYKRIRYQDLAKAIEKIYKNKKVKTN